MVYSIDLSLAQAATTLPRPDPSRPSQGNRRVTETHARAFGRYVRENEDWVAPGLLLRVPEGILHFDEEKQIGGMRFGILSVPRSVRTDLRILDGQHRILGLSLALEEIASELEKARAQKASARRNKDQALEKHFDKQVVMLENQRERFNRERVSVQVMVENDNLAVLQMFVDIADNALGITSAIRARFDTRKVINRALEGVLDHPLLGGRVDVAQDRVGPQSPALMAVKHVVDIVRVANLGINGRVGRRLESELKESDLVQVANSFLDTLVSGFEDMGAIVSGEMTPAGLRSRSLLGSITMLKVIAGAYHVLVSEGKTSAEVSEFFARLSPFMGAPVDEKSPWLTSGVFNFGSMAPQGRRQDLSNLVDTIAGWSKNSPSWMESKPTKRVKELAQPAEETKEEATA